MARYRGRLPQLDGQLFLTDGGIETTLIFHDRLDLPFFAAFDLLKGVEGTATLKRYFSRYAGISRGAGTGFIFESATWRASLDWGRKLGYSATAIDTANRKAIDILVELRDALETERSPMVISGCVGPRGDGYNPGALMTADEAEAYHASQIATFAETEADQVTAITMTNAAEAIGITRAARKARIPVAISFTVETDGRLPTGQTLAAAIAEVDAATANAPAYYMVNCAHPSHFADALSETAGSQRLRGIRANASRRSHAELDEATELDDGDPVKLAQSYAAIRSRFPWINILGGCCGTDHRHIEQIAAACVDLRPQELKQ